MMETNPFGLPEDIEWLSTTEETDQAIVDAFKFYVSLADPRDTIEFCTGPSPEGARNVLIHWGTILGILSVGQATVAYTFGHSGGGWRAYTSVWAWAKSAVTKAVTSPAGQVTALIAAEAALSHELYKTMTQNLEMEPVPFVPGAMTHPFEGGSDEIYYPGKGLVDWLTEKF